MSNRRSASWPEFNGQKVVLTNDVRLTAFQAGATPGLAMKVYAVTAASSASGQLSLTLPAGYFTTVYGVCPTVVRDTNAPASATFAAVRTFSNTAIVIQCFESKSTGVVLGGNVEGLEACATAITINVVVFGV